MKKIFYVLVLGMVLGLASPVFAQNVMTEMVVISAQAQIGTMTMVNYVSGKNFRMENYKGQGDQKTLQSVMIAKDGFMWMLTPAQKSGMKMALNSPMSGQKDSGKPQETSWAKVMEEQKAKGLTVTNRGKEKWEGQEYEVWRVVQKDGTYVDYYLEKNQMVKRFVFYNAKGQMQQDMRVIKYEALKALPAGALDIPSDYKIMDMSQMKMPGMGGGNGKP